MPKVHLTFDVSEETLSKLVPSVSVMADITTNRGTISVVNCSEDSHKHNVDGYNARIVVEPDWVFLNP